ncbi:MAG: PKD domain-containing protein, partial [Proteobacteria bacterium]|nr:PKD domain-containing protein [Pseudomonadota bacterium]
TANSCHQGEPVVYGDTIIYTSAQSGSNNLDLYYYNRTTGDSGPLATDSGNQSNADIFSDTVVYQSDQGGDEDLYLIHTDGSGKTAIVTGTERQTNPAIDSKDGRYVAYQSYNGTNWDVYVYDFNTGNIIPVDTGTANEENPSVNNGKVAYQKSGSSNIFVYYIQNGKTYQITSKTGTQEAAKPTIYVPTVACQERDSLFDNWEIAFYTLVHPIARFTVDSTSNTECHTFVFTDNSDSDGYQALTRWDWDFDNDGDTEASGQGPQSYTYPDNGVYTAKLTVTDANGDTSDTTTTITVNPVKPTAKFTVDSYSETECHTFSFTNNSDSDGCQALTYLWEFGDGDTSPATNPKHKYADNDTYTVKLTVTDDGGDTVDTTTTITVNSVKPTAKFSVDSNPDSECHNFVFTNNSDSDGCQALGYLWEFGDGDTSTDTDPNYQYTNDGNYTCTLTVTDAGGDISDTTIQIIVSSVDPVAKFMVDSYSDTQDHNFQFTDQSDSDGCQNITGWSWDFDGDGVENTNVQSPIYQYGADGTYTVRLTVTDANGDADDTTTQITVYYDNWKMGFSATGSSTGYCTAGIDPAGSANFDPGLDVPAPPIPGGGSWVAVYFNHPEYPDAATRRLETDIREKTVPLDDFKETWPICVLQNINTPGHNIELKKPNFTNVPLSLDVVLKDNVTGELKYIQFNGAPGDAPDPIFTFDSSYGPGRCYTLMVSGSDSTPDRPTWLAEKRDTFPANANEDDRYDTEGTFYVAWAQVAGATQYVLQQSTDGGGNWTTLQTDAITTWTVTGGVLGKTYEHRVRAIDSDGFYSDWTTAATITVDSTPPDSPGTPYTTPGGFTNDSNYTICWTGVTDPQTGACTYTLEESLNGGAWTQITTTSNTCYDTLGRADGKYTYRVKATNPAGLASDYSHTSDTLTVDTTAPDSPANVWEGDNACVGVDWDGDEDGNYWVAWNGVADAVLYKVWEGKAGGSWIDVGDTTDTCLRRTGKGTGTYYYKVTAKDAAGNWGDTSSVSDGISVADTTTYCHTFGADWNLISIPVNPAYTDPRDNFPCLNAGTCWLFGYDAISYKIE